MDLIAINRMIDELEESDTSLSNVRNLSALYNVRTQLLGTNTVIKELNDILPSYTEYIEVKKRYQLKFKVQNMELLIL